MLAALAYRSTGPVLAVRTCRWVSAVSGTWACRVNVCGADVSWTGSVVRSCWPFQKSR
jgi:hypothetical protein